MSESSGEKTSQPASIKILLYIAGLIGAITILLTNYGEFREASCKNIGVFCAKPEEKPKKISTVTGDEVVVASGGTKNNNSDECKTHQALACARISSPKSSIVPDSPKFRVTERSGAVYVDGVTQSTDPVNTTNIGWLKDEQKSNEKQYCVNIWARTSACETKVYIRGHVEFQESQKQ